ncbi:MAG: hypothetical protein WDM85_13420 [Caulobacteraceae bacterium]
MATRAGSASPGTPGWSRAAAARRPTRCWSGLPARWSWTLPACEILFLLAQQRRRR